MQSVFFGGGIVTVSRHIGFCFEIREVTDRSCKLEIQEMFLNKNEFYSVKGNKRT